MSCYLNKEGVNYVYKRVGAVTRRATEGYNTLLEDSTQFADATTDISNSENAVNVGKRAKKFNKQLKNLSAYTKILYETCDDVHDCIQKLYTKAKGVDKEAYNILKTAHKEINSKTIDDIKAVTTKTSTSEIKENKAKASVDDKSESISNTSVSSVKDAAGNTIDLENFQVLPFSTGYTQINDADRQKVMFLVGNNLDSSIQNYFTSNGYPLDGFGIIGIAVAESGGGGQNSKCIFGTDGGSNSGSSFTATNQSCIDTVAKSLVQAGICSDMESARTKATTDSFYKQLSAFVQAAYNATNDGVAVNTCWGVLNPSHSNIREATARWRTNYQNGTVDMSSGGTGAGGGRYSYKSY